MAKQGLIRDTRSSAAQTAPATGRVRSLLTFIFRLLLLGVSTSGAWLAGVAVAKYYYPAQSPAPPLQEIVLRRSSHFIRRIQRLSELWNQSSLSPKNLDPSFSSTESAPPPSQIVVSNPNPVRSLTAAEQQQVEQTLALLETELQDLSDRTTKLETQLGQPPSNSSLASRLQTLNRQISFQTAPAATGEAANTAAEPFPIPARSAPDSTTGNIAAAVAPLKVTLPSDLLFEDNQESLKAEAKSILDSIIPDLVKYPGAAILIGCHTDNQTEANISRELTFQQAIAIERRLAQILGHTYHFVPIGYGQTQPLASNNTATDRQRNRRIEIIIDSR